VIMETSRAARKTEAQRETIIIMVWSLVLEASGSRGVAAAAGGEEEEVFCCVGICACSYSCSLGGVEVSESMAIRGVSSLVSPIAEEEVEPSRWWLCSVSGCPSSVGTVSP